GPTVAASHAGQDKLERSKVSRIAHAQGLFHAELVPEQTRRHDWRLMVPGQAENAARLRHRAADWFIAKRGQTAPQCGSYKFVVIAASAGGIAEPDGVHVVHQFLKRTGDAHAGKGLDVIVQAVGRVGVHVSDARVGKWQLVEGVARITKV